MPGPYPAASPTLSGDLLTISRFLQSPTQLSRALRSIMNLRFVSDQLLTGQYRTSVGAISYEVSEPILNTRAVTAVAPGSAYPFDVPAGGTAALAAVKKWGEASFLSDEQVKRSVYAGNEIARTLQKAVNTYTLGMFALMCPATYSSEKSRDRSAVQSPIEAVSTIANVA